MINEMYLIKCDDPRTPVMYYVEEIALTLNDAIKIANKKDNFGVIELFTLQDGSFKSSEQYFNKFGQQTDFTGTKNFSNKNKFDSEIAETLRLAGVQLNENEVDLKKYTNTED